MKTLAITLGVIGLTLLMSATAWGQSVGDFGSLGTGTWGTTNANWRQWDGSGWNTVPASAPTASDNVWILSGHTVTVEASLKNCKNLTVESGAILRVSGTTVRYMIVSGSSVTNNGTLGGTSDGLSITCNISVTISGTGTTRLNRLRAGATSISIVIDKDMTLDVIAGGAALYSNSFSSVTFTVNSGRTVTFGGTSFFSFGTSATTSTALSGTVNVNGTMTLPSGMNFNMNVTSGNTATLNISGTLNGGGTLLADGAGTENVNINEGGALVLSSATTFENLAINNTSGFSPAQAITLNGTLTLTSGNITTTSSNLLTLGSAASVSGGSSSSFVSGPMAHTIANTSSTAKTFPIGKGSAYRPITLTVTQDAATSTTYTAEVFNSAPTTRTLPAEHDKVSLVRYWNVAKGAGANVTNGSITINYGADDGVTDPDHVRVAKDDGAGSWLALGGTGSGSGSGSIISNVNFTSFSDFTLMNHQPGTNPLPVQLTSFTATANRLDAVLRWGTATEVHNYGFEVERRGFAQIRTDSRGYDAQNDWKKVGFVAGSGNEYQSA